MALPSQVARPTTGRLTTGLSRPRSGIGGLRRPLTVLVVLAVAAGGVWALSRPSKGPVSPRTEKQSASTTKGKSEPAVTGISPTRGKLADLTKNAPETVKPPVIAANHETSPVVQMSNASLGASDAVKEPLTSTPAQSVATTKVPEGLPPPTNSTPTQTTPPPATTTAAPAGRLASVQSLIDEGESALARNALIDARDAFNRAFYASSSSPSDQDTLRGKLAAIAEKVTFSPVAYPDDRMASTYVIAGGDNLNRISREQGLQVDWRFIQRINQISDPRRIREGQKIKLLKGPFHVIVDKSDFRMDLFADATDSQGNRLLLKSMRVGLGEAGSTPLGAWVVRPQSKLVNPAWVNPRTGESFTADDPLNPIGERWVGIDGISESNRDKMGFGIHGTIDPDSIGKEMSMGCVRMDGPDIELVYELLVEGGTQIEIRP